jgi:hypothetical protein
MEILSDPHIDFTIFHPSAMEALAEAVKYAKKYNDGVLDDFCLIQGLAREGSAVLSHHRKVQVAEKLHKVQMTDAEKNGNGVVNTHVEQNDVGSVSKVRLSRRARFIIWKVADYGEKNDVLVGTARLAEALIYNCDPRLNWIAREARLENLRAIFMRPVRPYPD